MQIVKLSETNSDLIFAFFKSELEQDAWNLEQIKSSFNAGSTFFYGIFEKDELVCLASILVSVDDINLLDIATKTAHKRKGYARTLLNYLISLKKPNQTMSLEVRSKNLPAISLYKGLGFKALNIRKKYYKDGDDALCMFLE